METADKGERKHVTAQPRAKLVLIDTQPPLTPDGVTVERYATVKVGALYEKHIAPNGVVHWFRVGRGTVNNG